MSGHPDLAGALRALADLLDIRGSIIEACDLRRGAAALDHLEDDAIAQVIRLARRDRLDQVHTVNPLIHGRLREIVQHGADHVLDGALAALPRFIRHALGTSRLTASQAARIVRHFGIATKSDVQLVRQSGWLSRTHGADLDNAVHAAFASFPRQHLTLGRAWDVLEDFLTEIADHCPRLLATEPAGDVRRVEPVVDDVVLVASAEDPSAEIDGIALMGGVSNVLCRTDRAPGSAGPARGEAARILLTYQEVEIDVRVVRPDAYGSALFDATGSTAHVVAVAERRRSRSVFALEEDCYVDAGLPYIAPELRRGSDELAAALSHQLPALVERRHIRGDLHMHSHYSDGRDSVRTMVMACRAIGYEYIAITDHSEGAGASRTLRASDIAKQRDEIARLREMYPAIHVLHGVEVDILPDGRLDFADHILEQFDIVLASLHDRAGQDGRRLTQRCVEALRHPLVNVLTHPSNQLVGKRAGYPLDYEAVYLAAAESGTALEVDGAPGHLDLDGHQARAAAAAGATLTIDSDCHRAHSLERQMRLGVGTARRGWVEPRHVLNTRPLHEVRQFIARKRSGSR